MFFCDRVLVGFTLLWSIIGAGESWRSGGLSGAVIAESAAGGRGGLSAAGGPCRRRRGRPLRLQGLLVVIVLERFTRSGRRRREMRFVAKNVVLT